MKALRFERFGDPSVLAFQDVQAPKLAPGEALIEVKSAGINPSDLGNIAGRFGSKLPKTPGRDYAGLVIGGSDDWKGKEVWGSGVGFGVSRDGAHAQFVAVPSEWLSEKPASLSMEQAAAVGIPYLTAWQALVSIGQVREGEWVLITGANGAVGRAATQVAHWKKANVIGADRANSSPEADASVNTSRPNIVEEVRKITGGRGVDFVLDMVGAELFEPCLKSLAIGGRQIAIASPARPRVEFNLVDFYHNQARLLGLDTMKTPGPQIASAMNELRRGFDEGHLRPPEIQISPFEKAIEVYAGLASKTLRGKQVVSFNF
jgi:NADPH:quinone reductase